MSILTVRQLTAQIKDAVEHGFPYVWVRGEVTNVSRPASGHLYFSLKDENALLQAVWFKNNQKERETFDPLTGEVFEDGPRASLAGTLKNGQQIICAGPLTVYAPRGGYQLVVELAQDSGEGALYLALEALKRRLAEKGYFALEHKRPLPEHPRRISVITAPSGAAIRDFLRLAGERGTGCEICIHPVPVQGEEAPSRIAEALDGENRRGWAEVLVLIRGGGSLQDLWAFNDERVADAVYRSALPVLAGIGHEVDTSIADMVAGTRAATPSHAAQMLWPERRWYAQRIDDLETALREAATRRLAETAQRLDTAERALAWLSPERGLARLQERFDTLGQRLHLSMRHRLEHAVTTLLPLEAGLRRHAVPRTPDPRREQVDGLERRLRQAQRLRLEQSGNRLEAASANLTAVFLRHDAQREHSLERLELQLRGLDPNGPLERGYACALTEDGRFLRSIRDMHSGMSLTVKLRDGEANTRVTAVREQEDSHALS